MGFDIIGSKQRAVAIIEDGKDPKAIASTIMEKHKNVHSVLQRISARRGKYRLYKYKLIAGSRNTEVVHRESGCNFMLDPKKVYFSPREGTERMRIAKKIGTNEHVAVFFAGVGPFALVAAKHSRAAEIIGIEINPAAVKYFKRNILLNKTKNVSVVKGDVAKIARRFYGKFDRIVMPLPERGIEYLGYALKCLKKRGIVHFYCFAKEEEIEKWKRKIAQRAKRAKKKIKFLEIQKVLPWGPRIWKTRFDIAVRN
jgi:tRNA (guanine37-N1)-methyltransferase